MYEQIKTIENYNKLLASGMFWEFHPELSGDWNKDKNLILDILLNNNIKEILKIQDQLNPIKIE